MKKHLTKNPDKIFGMLGSEFRDEVSPTTIDFPEIPL
jgi:hypothetical protein